MHHPSSSEFDPSVEREIKIVAGQTKIGMNHNLLTPEFVIDALKIYMKSGKVLDGFDREALGLLREIPAIRAALQDILIQRKPAVVQRPEKPYVTPVATKPAAPKNGAKTIPQAIGEVLNASERIVRGEFEKRPFYRDVFNDKLSTDTKREVARIYAVLALTPGAQEMFLDAYQFTAQEMEEWSKMA